MKEKIVILGAQESGVGAAVLAKRKGYDVFLSEYKSISEKYLKRIQDEGIEFEQGGHTASRILAGDIIIKSPGIPETASMMLSLRNAGKKIVSEIEFASWFTNSTLIAITGSNGKTTTTLLTHHVMKKAGLDVACGGNIGSSFALLLAERDYDYFLLEVSSFQLDDIHNFRPKISVLLNITPDHLDRYDYDLKKYADSKFRVVENQGPEDYFIYCNEDPITLQYLNDKNIRAKMLGFGLEKQEGAVSWFENNTITIQMEQDRLYYDYDQMNLKGKHNVYNTMAAAIVSRIIDIRKDVVRESFSDFHNVEHRLEKVANIGGVEFINDSKATNVNSAWYALESMDKEVIWIAGGVDKGNDYSILVPLVEKKVKAIVALGQDVRKIHEAFSKKVNLIIHAMTMEEAVRYSYSLADKGDCVLLSPACASFDLFENYEDRGRRFKSCIAQIS